MAKEAKTAAAETELELAVALSPFLPAAAPGAEDLPPRALSLSLSLPPLSLSLSLSFFLGTSPCESSRHADRCRTGNSECHVGTAATGYARRGRCMALRNARAVPRTPPAPVPADPVPTSQVFKLPPKKC